MTTEMNKTSDDINKLIGRLRSYVRSSKGDIFAAVDTIEALRAERDQMLIDLEEYRRDVAKLTEERDRLKAALGGVMEWIDNWSPPFTQDREWAKTELKARKALEAKE